MIFKKAMFLTAFILFSGNIFGADKWNIQLANLMDMSRVKDRNTGVTIQKSIASQLSRQNGFNLVQLRTNVYINDFKEALSVGRANKADIILYGDYYIEGEDLVIVVDVYDVLENRLKMRKYYSGKVDLDIFDTIDAMTADLVKKIREALPELTADSQERVKLVRQNVYETEKISVKRMFYTRFGFNTELGPKQFYYYTSASYGQGFPDPNLGKTLLFSSVPFGLALRIWEIRLDMLFSMANIPWQFNDWSYNKENQAPGNYGYFTFSFYLPWFNNSLAISAGSQFYDMLLKFKFDTMAHTVSYARISLDSILNYLSVGLIWNVNPNIELTLLTSPWMSYDIIAPNYNNGVLMGTNHNKYWRDFPALSLGAIFFLGNFGLEARLTADSYHFIVYNTDDSGATNYNVSHNGDGGFYTANTTWASFYLGFVYRVDFLK